MLFSAFEHALYGALNLLVLKGFARVSEGQANPIGHASLGKALALVHVKKLHRLQSFYRRRLKTFNQSPVGGTNGNHQSEVAHHFWELWRLDVRGTHLLGGFDHGVPLHEGGEHGLVDVCCGKGMSVGPSEVNERDTIRAN